MNIFARSEKTTAIRKKKKSYWRLSASWVTYRGLTETTSTSQYYRIKGFKQGF